MAALAAAKALLPPVVLAGGRALVAGAERGLYEAGGRVPWSRGYHAAKWRLLRRTFADEALLARFRAGAPLPAGHGVGVDERCVEYPWALSRLPAGPGRLLDAGSTLNNEFWLGLPGVSGKKVHVLTLGPETGACWWTGASFLYEDLRDVPMRDALYDHVVCISTLEHVGFDNTAYVGAAGADGGDVGAFRGVMRELARVLRPGGTLLLTVPYGRLARGRIQQQFDAALLDEAVRAFAPSREERTFYAYDARGWRTAAAEECAALEGADWRRLQARPRPAEPDLAAASRAVACVRLVK